MRGDRDENPSERRSESTTRRRLLSVGGVGIGAAAVGAPPVGGVQGGEDGTEPDDDGDGEDDADTDLDAEEDGEDVDPLEDQPLVDAHVHLIPERGLDREPLTADELVEWMDANDVDQAAVLSLEAPESYPVTVPGWWVLDRAAEHPDRLLPFCTVDPRKEVFDRDVVAEQLERYVERGARGFGELKPGLPIDDRRLEFLYERCASHDLPILFHTDENAMRDEVGLPGLEDVLASYPEVDFVAHATGWWSHVSADVAEDDLGGYPDGPVEPGGRVPELLDGYDNVYGDVSARSGWNALTREESFGQSLLERHHDQLVFGTDYVYPGQSIDHFELFDRFDLPDDAWADVRYRNLLGVLR